MISTYLYTNLIINLHYQYFSFILQNCVFFTADSLVANSFWCFDVYIFHSRGKYYETMLILTLPLGKKSNAVTVVLTQLDL